MTTTADKGWARVSLMGHKTFCGYVSTDGGLEKIEVYAESPVRRCAACGGSGVVRTVVTTEIPLGGGVHDETCGECAGDGTLLVQPVSRRWFGSAAVYDIEQISETEALAFVQRQIAERERMEQWRREREEQAAALALAAGEPDDEYEDAEEIPY